MAPELPSVLHKIVAHKREEIAAGKAARPRFDLMGLPAPRAFAAAIAREVSQGTGEFNTEARRHGETGREGSAGEEVAQRDQPVRLIAEVKRASPVKGVLRADFDPLALARTYAENGAAAISVLTDVRFFQGHPDYLRQIHEVVPVPLLRKDFVIDEWQLPESRALGADAVLLIAAILSPSQLRDYLQVAQALRMDALVEVHSEPELEVALASEARVIGVNNRDLNTFVTDLATTERFAARIKGDVQSGRLLVSESGVCTAVDVARLAALGVDAVLVGEALMREQDVAGKVRELAGRSCA